MSLEEDFFSGQPRVINGVGGLQFHQHSNLTGAINDARSNTGRDSNGNVTNEGHTGNWLGNLGYFALIDLLATCFFNVTTLPAGDRRKNSVIFPAFLASHGVPPADAEVIYALRCSFAHEYGLANIRRNLWFTVSGGVPGQIVTPATTQWDGEWSNLSNDNATRINLRALADMP